MVGIAPLAALPSMPAASGIGSIGGATGIGGAGGVTPAGASGTGSFSDAIGNALNSLNTQLSGADSSMQAFASGQSADIGTVMLEMQQASLDLKLGTQVRDRLLDAYNTVMRLQL